MIGLGNMNSMLSIQNTYQIKINNKYYKTNHIKYSKLKYKYPSKPVDITLNPVKYILFLKCLFSYSVISYLSYLIIRFIIIGYFRMSLFEEMK